MILAEHGRPAIELVAVARLFRFRDGGGYGNGTEAGYLAIKPSPVIEADGTQRTAWHLSIDGKRLAEMVPTHLADGRPALVGSFCLCHYVLLAADSPVGRGPQTTLYVTQVPPT